MIPQVIAVVGATATGKSDLALDLAESLGGEVVNADAMQLYRGMDIGTNKLPVDERRGIAHHVLDVLEVTDEATLADYQERAETAIAEVLARGRLPVLAGGSGLYVRAALDHLEIPPTDPTVRARLEAEAEGEGGVAALRARLRSVDPAAAEAIQANNIRRIIRALEVVEITGRPFSATAPTKRYRRPSLVIGLRDDWDALTTRIERRAARMWADGLLEEVSALDAAGLRRGRTASRAIGYSQALAELDGRITREEAIAQTAQATRRYARRQESWWRPDHRVEWRDAADPGLAETATALAGRPTRHPPAEWTP
ncbi:tRNA (adenosine(37)-N6)-dimethylallyltransferase MiaA [Janibacter cremeus]|uniref:tRNA (adenosine(37)-N6)-dimethylallyltransferase MiaA n=1 Tax=Janibacter cremeus TaxID=1285192 RepID=UPI0023F7D28D|nr:tRNA (adenosine(37)-N6)-dimethylallyltransferase MiaA [Janibacter cremeus]WEV79422.1 tRNA (adenosine(37)-N6)-dimethylallyltransferase MiaA [Janibacter cremeus]